MGLATARWRGDRRADPTASGPANVEVEIVSGPLLSTLKLAGSLDYGEARDAMAEGVVTWVPEVGTKLGPGDRAFEIEGRPVFVLESVLPLWRCIGPGTAGPDVLALRKALHSAGFDTGPEKSDEYDQSLGNAINALYERAGYTRRPLGESCLEVPPVVPEEGIEPQQPVLPAEAALAVTQAPVRVTAVVAEIGQRAAGPVIAYGDPSPSVRVDLTAGQGELIREGDKAWVDTAEGHRVKATVEEVTSPTPADAGTSGPAARAYLGAPEIDSTFPVGSVVTFIGPDVSAGLIVPVTALVAKAFDAYAVELADGRSVPVQIGLVADGKVEIFSDELVPGMRVLVPQ
jgi:hypothetical protein